MFFRGDYVDSFEVSNEQQLMNFTDIIAFRQANPQQVVLLLGNHCFQYLHLSVAKLFVLNEDLYLSLHLRYKLHHYCFQVAHQVGNTLFVHAGISQAQFTHHEPEISQQREVLAEAGQPAQLAGSTPYWPNPVARFSLGAGRGPRWHRPVR